MQTMEGSMTIGQAGAAAARRRARLSSFALTLILAAVFVYAARVATDLAPGGAPRSMSMILDVAALLLVAVFLHVCMKAVDAGERRVRSLMDINSALAGQEQELLLRVAELDRRRIEAEEASSQKSRLLASLSHDIRTPVNAIGLRAEIIRRAAEDPRLADKLPAMAAALQANAASLADLLSAMLDHADFATGRVATCQDVFSLTQLAVAICAELQPMAEKKSLYLDCDLPAGDLRLRTDRAKLARVIRNLVANAIRFTTTGGVTVGVDLAPGAALVRVHDTGVGMEPKQLEVAFDLGSRLEVACTELDRGWGLGLPICRHLLGLMGCRIEVESRLNHGSTFTVHIPSTCVVGTGVHPQPSGGR
jgi:signal transduction histidine kinase